KSTLGKVGTIFGLILGGAGATASKTADPMMGMMDKEIDRDVAAQVQSKTNAQNFYKINLESEMNQANIKHLESGNVLNEAQSQGLIAEAKLKAVTTAKMQTAMSTFHDMAQRANSLPPGSPQA